MESKSRGRIGTGGDLDAKRRHPSRVEGAVAEIGISAAFFTPTLARDVRT